MKPMLISVVLCMALITILLPVVYALTPRSEFGDNVSTYRFFGGTRVCGDHLCKPGEWNTWVSNMFFSHIKKFSNSFGVKNPFSSEHIKSASYDTSSLLDKTTNGDITRVSIFAMNDGRYTSFVSITNSGLPDANHIVIAQLNPDVKILTAWISPQWNTSISLYQTVFDTSKTSLGQGETLNIVIVTDGKPVFSLGTLAVHSIISLKGKS